MFKLFRLKSAEYPIFLLWLLIASLYIRPYNGIMQPFYEYGNYCVFGKFSIEVQKSEGVSGLIIYT